MPALMNRITWHHSGGGYKPSKEDLAAYHVGIDGDGAVVWGDHPIAANAAGTKLVAGHYAPHTWKLNSGNIGIAVFAMSKGEWSDPFGGTAPVLPRQIDSLIDLTAKLVREYDISVNERQVLGHAEVQPTLGVTQKNKWDFDYDVRRVFDNRDPLAVGNVLRQELRLKLGNFTALPGLTPAPLPQIRQGALGEDVRTLQKLLRITVDGAFGPKTRDAVIAFQRKNELLPDGVVGSLTWAMLRGTGKRK